MTVDRSDPDAPLIRVGGELAYTTGAPLRTEVDRMLAAAPPADFRPTTASPVERPATSA